MKTQEILDQITELKNQGRTFVTFEWISKHNLLGNIKKQSRHNINDLNELFIESNVRNLTDYHIV